MNNSWRANSAQALATARIKQYGTLTSVNGGKSRPAVWTEAGIARTQLFLQQNEWTLPSFDVIFPASAVDSLVNGAIIVRLMDGWRGVVRMPDDHPIVEIDGAITVLVVLTSE